MESYLKGNETSERSSKRIEAQEQTVEQDVLLGTDYVETHVFHDFIYSEIEEELSDVIDDVEALEDVGEPCARRLFSDLWKSTD